MRPSTRIVLGFVPLSLALLLSALVKQQPPSVTPESSQSNGQQQTPDTRNSKTNTSTGNDSQISKNDAADEQKKREAEYDRSLYHAYEWATIAGVIGGWVVLIIVGIQTRAATISAKAAKVSADIAVTAQRAWIEAEMVSIGPISFDEVGMRVLFTVKGTNVGHSPAMNATVHHRPINERVKDTASIQQDIIPKARPLGIPWGETLFPGRHFTRQLMATVEREKLDKEFPGFPKGTILLQIVGCIDYALGSSTDYHQTFFAGDVFTVDADGQLISLTDGINVPSDKIKYRPIAYLGGGAN